MNLLSFLWRRLRHGGCADGCRSDHVVQGLRRQIRFAADLNYAEVANSNRQGLDALEREQATGAALRELVERMSRGARG